MSPEDMQRYEVQDRAVWDDSELWLCCTRCEWETQMEFHSRWPNLAELVQRAGEHTEVCR